LLLTGSATSFRQQPLGVRHQVLQGWQQSYLPQLRAAAKLLGNLFKSAWVKSSPTLGRAIGFPRVPVHGKPGKGFDYDFIQFPPGEAPEIIETDVVIVGSGCGGAVCAKNIAEAGHRVTLVERSYHFPPEHFPMTAADGQVHMFQNGGYEVSDDGSISVVAGRAWGGGGTVNWSASLQTQDFVRQEWADQGLPFFTSPDFQASLDRVCHRMGVSADHINHSRTNRVLIEGARRLGMSCSAVPQNTGGKQHYCGYCNMGCGSAEKQGPVVSFLPDAQRAGARFIEGFSADKVLFEKRGSARIAVGVQGAWRSRDSNHGLAGDDRITRTVIVKAKRVIVSCGSLSSPLLLLRSGLDNPQIGRNLYLHPVTVLAARFAPTPEAPAVNPWEGSILTAVVDSLNNLDGNHHGAKLEAFSMLPAMLLPFLPWTSAVEFKLRGAQFRHMTGMITLSRDRDPGRVYPDPNDPRECRIAYTPSALTRQHILEGLIALAKICYVEGAEEIITGTIGVPPFKRSAPSSSAATSEGGGINDPEFQAWLAMVRAKGLPSPAASFGSAHQMGTCRMGVSARSSVVDPHGKVWGTEGLYVADASVFPSASGVNPMVTNMAISDWISRGIAKDLDARERAML
jgi:choline dehydrogenase-like flavoprotein